MPEPNSLDYLRAFPDRCCAEVTRRGMCEPCDKPAVAATYDPDGPPWPVCAYHTRGRDLVPLAVLLGLR